MHFQRSWLDRSLWPSLALFGAMLAVFQFTPADLLIQDRLFDFRTGRWLVDRNAWWPTFLFHKLPKYLIIGFAVLLLLKAHAAGRWKKFSRLKPVPWRRAWVVLGCLALTPVSVSIGKQFTNVFCPWDVERYGGPQPYVRIMSAYDPAHPPSDCGKCWPAGHASAGFALVALASLAATTRGRLYGTLTGLLTGGVMGIYQMMKGAHYTSDTLATLFLAWIIHLLLRRALKPDDPALK